MTRPGTSMNLEYIDAKAIPSVSPSISSFQVEDVATLDQMLKNGQLKQVKSILRSHHWPIDHPIRKELWITLARYNRTENHDAGYYGNTVNEQLGKKRTPVKVPSFVDPVYSTSYYLNDRGQKTVARILSVVCESRPGITYAPLLYPLVSLFLHYMSEEEAFNCVSDLISANKEDFVSLSKASHDGKSGMAISLAKKYAVSSNFFFNMMKYQKKGYIHLQDMKSNSKDLEKSFQRWQYWIILGLPFPYLVRLIDCFLLEGSKVILRILLAVLVLYSKYSGSQIKAQSGGDIDESLSAKILHFCQTGLDPLDKFYKVAFGIRGLSRKEIRKHTARAESQFQDQAKSALPISLSSSDSLYQIHATSPMAKNGLKRTSPTGHIGLLDFENFTSGILTTEQMNSLWSWLPVRVTTLEPNLVYSTDEHGSCLTAFFSRVDIWEPTILLVKANNDDVFGAFCATSWSARSGQDEDGNQKRYFGTGETFLFTLHPKAEKFPWVGLKKKEAVNHSAELFMSASKNWISVGAGNGTAIWLDESLNMGKTERCDTFNNPPLCSLGDFTSKVVEVVGFD